MRTLPLGIAFVGMGAFVAAAAIGPLFSDPAYSSISHTTSELAGQAMPNAWIMRWGFAAFGTCTALAACLRLRASAVTAIALMVFGAAMTAAAVWSNAPIHDDVVYSVIEDQRHSLAATLMGFAFAAATAARLWLQRFALADWLSWLGLVSSIVLPLMMAAAPDLDGALQRVMFAISFIWIAREMSAPAAKANPSTDSKKRPNTDAERA